MEGSMLRRLSWLVAAVVMVAGAGLTSGASAHPSKAGHSLAPKAGGTLAFGFEQEPPCMNPDLNDCNNTWQLYVSELVLRSVYVVNPKFVYTNDLVTKVS